MTSPKLMNAEPDDDGRTVLQIPLNNIQTDYLLRDRMVAEVEDMRTLVKSLHANGQRTPIEVERINGVKPFGLISGWRRISGLQQLRKMTGDAKYDTVLALVRKPGDSADSYVSMVEENEIRVDLSYYERARIAAQSTRRGVFASEKLALQRLFAAASRAKRSRIRSFIDLYAAFDPVLKFPNAIPERLGLSLVDALRSRPDFAAHVKNALSEASINNSEDELALLTKLAKPDTLPKAPIAKPVVQKLPNGFRLSVSNKKIEITGNELTPELARELRELLECQPNL